MQKKKVLSILVVMVIVLFLWVAISQNAEDLPRSEPGNTENSSTVDSSSTPTKTKLKTFTGDEFKALYDNLSLPNTTPIVQPPEITGNRLVDEHIHSLAEQRGYQLRLVAASDLNEFGGHELQVLLLEEWKNLKQAAKIDGIDLKIVSGYRSVEDQRIIFLEQFNALGLSSTDVVNGAGDEQIDRLLQTAAPPGYSRHHSGYTIDIADTSTTVFAYSQGYQWISANNFENAKKFGFIPSYPEDVLEQGPNPEPWEYVWANREFVVE